MFIGFLGFIRFNGFSGFIGFAGFTARPEAPHLLPHGTSAEREGAGGRPAGS